MQPPQDDWPTHAREHLHWFSVTHQAWLAHTSDSTWTGWSIDNAADISADRGLLSPWTAVCDTSEAPYVRWFCGALTSAAFNELDRHVLQARAAHVSKKK